MDWLSLGHKRKTHSDTTQHHRGRLLGYISHGRRTNGEVSPSHFFAEIWKTEGRESKACWSPRGFTNRFTIYRRLSPQPIPQIVRKRKEARIFHWRSRRFHIQCLRIDSDSRKNDRSRYLSVKVVPNASPLPRPREMPRVVICHRKDAPPGELLKGNTVTRFFCNSKARWIGASHLPPTCRIQRTCLIQTAIQAITYEACPCSAEESV